MTRTFIAINIPDSIKSIIADFQGSLKNENIPVRWIKPENIHLTLKFIGEIPGETVDSIKKTLFKIPPMCRPFEITVGGTGVFPNKRKPRIFWAGIKSHSDNLIELSEKIEEKLLPLGIKKEKRAFMPHLTIGRIKNPRPIKGLERFISPDYLLAGTFQVKEIVLMKSMLRQTGAEYTPLAAHSLIA